MRRATPRHETTDLEDLAALEGVRRVDRLELEVARRLRVQQHLHELAARHHALGDQVDVPVAVVAWREGRSIDDGTVGHRLAAHDITMTGAGSVTSANVAASGRGFRRNMR